MTTVYIGGIYEYAGGVVDMRSGGTVYYLLTDHLNSTARIVNSAGTIQSTSYYYPFGGNRGGAFSTLTTKRFTGQYHESTLPGGEGLSFYNARWYDAKLGRFVSADSLVPSPGNPQSFNRYSYVHNNPLKYNDPSGHREVDCGPGENCSGGSGGFKGNDGVYKQMLFWHGVFTAFGLYFNEFRQGRPISVKGFFRNFVITEPRVSPPPTSNNMTGWLSLQLYSLAGSDRITAMKYMHNDGPWGFVAATDLWAASVGTGGIWDFKKDILDAGVQDENGNIVIGKQTLNFQSVANITFGFAGSEVGFSAGFLHFGAGLAQYENGQDAWFENWAWFILGQIHLYNWRRQILCTEPFYRGEPPLKRKTSAGKCKDEKCPI